jgi:SAM-dependent methyltransferase
MLRVNVAERLFHLVTDRDYAVPAPDDHDWDYAESSVSRFLVRFGGPLEFGGKTVIDIGCGSGVLCVEAARRGASEVVGVDAAGIDSARGYVRQRASDVRDRVQFLQTGGTLDVVAGRRFDLVLSKDSFEHYDNPESFIHEIASLVAPRGELVIGFGPLWKSPLGGHIEYMTKLPWAHLMFPERVIMRERRRFRPHEDAETFGQILGGLNKMTYGRFRRILETSGLECVYLATNVSDSRIVKAMDLVSRIPPLREYFTQSVYTILRKPERARNGEAGTEG